MVDWILLTKINDRFGSSTLLLFVDVYHISIMICIPPVVRSLVLPKSQSNHNQSIPFRSFCSRLTSHEIELLVRYTSNIPVFIGKKLCGCFKLLTGKCQNLRSKTKNSIWRSWPSLNTSASTSTTRQISFLLPKKHWLRSPPPGRCVSAMRTMRTSSFHSFTITPLKRVSGTILTRASTSRRSKRRGNL